MRRLPFVIALVVATSFVPVAFGASSAAERLRALGDEMLEGEYDLVPAMEAFAQGVGPRAKRTIIDLAPGFRDRARRMYEGVLERLDKIPRGELDERGRIDHDLLRLEAESGLAENRFPLRDIGILTPNRGLLTLTINVATGSQPRGVPGIFAMQVTATGRRPQMNCWSGTAGAGCSPDDRTVEIEQYCPARGCVAVR